MNLEFILNYILFDIWTCQLIGMSKFLIIFGLNTSVFVLKKNVYLLLTLLILLFINFDDILVCIDSFQIWKNPKSSTNNFGWPIQVRPLARDWLAVLVSETRKKRVYCKLTSDLCWRSTLFLIWYCMQFWLYKKLNQFIIWKSNNLLKKTKMLEILFFIVLLVGVFIAINFIHKGLLPFTCEFSFFFFQKQILLTHNL